MVCQVLLRCLSLIVSLLSWTTSPGNLLKLGRTQDKMREIVPHQRQGRVAAAQLEYMRRVCSNGESPRPVPGPKIGRALGSDGYQSRVRSLMGDVQRTSNTRRAAEEHQEYTIAAMSASGGGKDKAVPVIPHKPAHLSKSKMDASAAKAEPTISLPMAQLSNPPRLPGSKPAAPKKPSHLQSLPLESRPPSFAEKSYSSSERLTLADLSRQPMTEHLAQQEDDSLPSFAKSFCRVDSMAQDTVKNLRTRSRMLWEFLSTAVHRELVPSQFASGLQNLAYNNKFAICYEFHDVDLDTAIQGLVTLLENLQAVGLQTEVRAGYLETLLVFVKAPWEILGNAVYKSRVRDWLYGIIAAHPGGGRSSIVAAQYEAEDLLSMYHLVTWPKEMGGAGITPGYGLFKNVKSCFPLHNPRASRSLLRHLGKKIVLHDKDFDLIRDLLGSKAAFYFAFNQTYILFLFFPAASGLLARIFLPLNSWFYTILIGLWSIVFTEYWKIKQTDLSIRWDVKGVSSLKTHRPQFIYEKTFLDDAGRLRHHYPEWKQIARRLVQVPFVLLAATSLGALIAVVYAIEVLISEVYDGSYKPCLEYLPPALLAVIMPYISQFLEGTAESLTQFENHRSADSHEQSLAQKVFVLKFITLYLPILLTAFVYVPFGDFFVPHLKSFLCCIIGDVASFSDEPFHIDKIRLQREVIALTVTGQIAHFGEKFLVPSVKQYIRSWRRKYRVSHSTAVPLERVVQDHPEEQAFLSTARCQASLPPYDVQADISQIVLQFGCLALFSPVWPLVPIGFLINNWIELRSDFLKICIEHQRPTPLRTDGIGPWAQNLSFLTWLGSISTAAITHLFDAPGDWSSISGGWWRLLVTIIISEHVFLAVRTLVQSVMQRIGSKQIRKESDADYLKRKRYLAELEAKRSDILGLGPEQRERGKSFSMQDGSSFWTRQSEDGKSKSVGIQLIRVIKEAGWEKDGKGKVD